MASFLKGIWRSVVAGRQGILLGAIGGLVAYYILPASLSQSFSLMSAAQPSIVEQATQWTISYKPQLMMILIGAFVGWVIDTTGMLRRMFGR